MVLVSFQGERGAYSEAAAEKFFEKCTTLPLGTFADALDAAADGRAEYAILPVENSLEGSIGASYDLLHHTMLRVTGEIYHRIEHCLIGSGSLENTDTIYSHPQALGQCRKFIEQHNMKTIPTYDTAGSVKIVKGLDNNCASIASQKASAIYGVPIITRNIADNPNNHTRFLILAQSESSSTGSDKTSIIFSIRHEPGSLYRILAAFNESGINLTKIESRPTKTNAWEYNFYVDFEGHKDDPQIQKVLEQIERETTFIKVLGSYPAAG
ncbi:MAG: prephenate dehydratase [Nitrosopumilus sp. B06]|nr:MAG: prephenate dehydratase [Nitrosopumilus sp. D6]RNJ80550.1 MAG: prephenate dehydratase [Nitrosopumilus sp. B06]